MDEVQGLNTNILLIGMLGMFLLALAIVFFVAVYQKKMYTQQRRHEELKSAHQLDLLKGTLISQEAERGRIARDIHDDVGAMLSTTMLYFNQMDIDIHNKDLGNKINALFEETIQSVRRISQDLRPVVLENLGLVEAIKNLVGRMNAVTDFEICFEFDYSRPQTKEYELCLYRIVQELLSNAIKHSKAKEVKLNLFSSHNVCSLNYMDNGIGLRFAEKPKGLGLKNIESRVKIMGGDLSFSETSNQGMILQIRI
jgi:signal transduction histidine kinase